MSKTGKIVTIFLWVLIIISAVLLVSLMANISENDQDPTMGSWINSNLIWAYVLVIAGVGVILVSAVMHAVSDLSSAKKGLMAVGFFAVIGVISYALSSDAIPQFLGVEKFINDGTLTAKVAKLVDMGLYSTYILIGIAILSIAFSSVTRLFK